jgi:hypothetical protein
MKNGINTGQFQVKTGSRGNGRKNLSHFRKYRNETRKYGNEWTKVENDTDHNGIFPVHFQGYMYDIRRHRRIMNEIGTTYSTTQNR